MLDLSGAQQAQTCPLLQGVAEAECRRAADAAEAAYQAAFQKDVVPDEASLDREHARCLSLAHQQYAADAVGQPLPCWHSWAPAH